MSSADEKFDTNEKNSQSSGSRPMLRLNRNEIEEYLIPNSNVTTMNATYSTKQRKKRSKESKTLRQNDQIENEYNSWKWQPTVRLLRITQQDIKNAGKSNANPRDRTLPNISPISFDHDEPFIREISPQTANQAFEKKMIQIKKSIQPILTTPSDVPFKPVRKKTVLSKSRLEYEETLKRLQKKPKTPSKGVKQPTTRKLYNHRDSFEEIEIKENVDEFEMQPGQKHGTINLKPAREILNRSVKNVNYKEH